MTTPLEIKMTALRNDGKFVPPVVHPAPNTDGFPVTQAWGVPNDRYAAGHHTGIDYGAPVGSRAIAVTWGEVIEVSEGHHSWGSAYGNVVTIRRKNGKQDYGYCHLSEIRVKVGDEVVPGTVIGLTGNSGNSTGPHLHFEVRPAGGHYGSDVNPDVLQAKD